MYIKRYDGPSGRGLSQSLIGSGRGFYGPSTRDFDTTGTRG